MVDAIFLDAWRGIFIHFLCLIAYILLILQSMILSVGFLAAVNDLRPAYRLSSIWCLGPVLIWSVQWCLETAYECLRCYLAIHRVHCGWDLVKITLGWAIFSSNIHEFFVLLFRIFLCMCLYVRGLEVGRWCVGTFFYHLDVKHCFTMP